MDIACYCGEVLKPFLRDTPIEGETRATVTAVVEYPLDRRSEDFEERWVIFSREEGFWAASMTDAEAFTSGTGSAIHDVHSLGGEVVLLFGKGPHSAVTV